MSFHCGKILRSPPGWLAPKWERLSPSTLHWVCAPRIMEVNKWAEETGRITIDAGLSNWRCSFLCFQLKRRVTLSILRVEPSDTTGAKPQNNFQFPQSHAESRRACGQTDHGIAVSTVSKSTFIRFTDERKACVEQGWGFLYLGV